MPKAIILYEIDKSFGPNILADYYLQQDDKMPMEVLKEFLEKHVDKKYSEVTIRDENNRYYSHVVDTASLDKEDLYIGFILQEGEDLLSLKSIFINIEKKIIHEFSDDKKKMSEILKDGLNSILTLIQKLQEPEIIKDILNERTKKMLDDGLLQEARQLIDLGEEIPSKLAEEVKFAEELLNQRDYKKAKRNFQKASELAGLIQEDEIAIFLEKKGEKIGLFPDLLKEREILQKEIEKTNLELENNKLVLFGTLVNPVERLIEISNDLEEDEKISNLLKLKSLIKRATRLAKELDDVKNKIKENYSSI
jgi:hypothetical protein